MQPLISGRTQGLLIVGNPAPFHVGGHLMRAAQADGLEVHVCDTTAASKAPWAINKANWWLRGHRPSRLTSFSQDVVRDCQRVRPRWLLATGLAPLDQRALQAIGRLGVQRLNFLTDDPWNPAHRSPWFMQALDSYDHVFTPRRQNLAQLQAFGCPQVSYLPFAYAPDVHFPDPPVSSAEHLQYDCDVVFAGGADPDRLPWVHAMLDAGFKVMLYGNYWDRHSATRPCYRGHADVATLRKAVGGAKVALCLVRQANRDGNVMRTFEVPAMGACMLTEDTEEHRAIFGPDGQAVTYFSGAAHMVEKIRWLLDHESERQRLAGAARAVIVQGHHRYQDRLKTMLDAPVVSKGV